MKKTSLVYVLLWLFSFLLLLGCGNGQAPFNFAMHVVVQPATPAFDAGKSVNLSAVVQNDYTGRGVTWHVEGTNCKGAACGTLEQMCATNAVYVPPASAAAGMSVKIVATSVANNLVVGSTTLTEAHPLTISTASLIGGNIGYAYSQTLAATGGVAPYIWTVKSGALPDGLTLDEASGTITGTPTTAKNSDFVVQVADFGGVAATAEFHILVQDVGVTILPNIDQTIEPSQTVAFTAEVRNDPSNLGVKWSIAGPKCDVAPCGAVTNPSALAATYVAPTAGTTETPLMVIATSVADPFRAASEHLFVAAQLQVATNALMSGNIGVSYADRVTASGGIAPYSFSVAAGALPPGLVMDQATGAISGVPTTNGTNSMTVTVTDAGGAFAQRVTKSLSITIGNALPLVITTESLPDATVNAAYTLQLEAAGGLTPYSWSVAGGALPAGLSLSSDGVLSGTPTVTGAFSVTVQVMDAEATPLTATKSFTMNVGYPHGPHDSALNGHYAFLFSGYEDGAGAVAAGGSFAADGNGNITGGVMDVNRVGGVTLGALFAGHYLIGLDNRGMMMLQMSSGQTVQYSFAVDTASGAVAQRARFIEFDDANGSAGTRGSGVMRLQDAAAFTQAAMQGNYVFGLAGETAAGSGTAGPVAIAGVVTADGAGNLTSGTKDVDVVNVVSTGVSVTGSNAAPDAATGRTLMTMQATGSVGALPADYVAYIVSSDQVLVLSTDLRAQASVLSGEVNKQKLIAFTNASFGTSFVIYENGANADASNQPVAGQTNSLVAVYSADGSGNCTLQAMDQNAGGVIQTFEQTGQMAAVSCNVQPNGRATLTSKQTMYLYDTGTGYYIENGLATLGHVEPQSGGPFTNASVPTTFYFGSVAAASTSAKVAVGTGSFEHQAAFSPVADISTPMSLQPGVALFLPYVVDTYGRAILPDKQGGDTQGGIYVMYVLSPTRMIWFDENTANSSPSMEVVDAQTTP